MLISNVLFSKIQQVQNTVWTLKSCLNLSSNVQIAGLVFPARETLNYTLSLPTIRALQCYLSKLVIKDNTKHRLQDGL